MRQFIAIIIAFIAFVLQASAERVDYFATSFDSGMPDGALSLDLDEQTLHFTMVQAGFDQGDAWKVFTLDGNSYAASPGRHKVAKGESPVAADDWLVLPAVRIMDSDAQLTWCAKTIAESIEEGCSYDVCISTRGPQPADFDGAPCLSVESEAIGKWTSHTLPLADYAGQEVWIAFVHNSLNREILALDDVCVSGSPGLYQLSDCTAHVVEGTDEAVVTMHLAATSAEPIGAFTAYCKTQGRVLSTSYDNANLTIGGPAATIEFVLPDALTPGERAEYAVQIEVDGNDRVEQPAVEGSIYRVLFRPKRRAVVEEGTGMWCGYCPRGIVAMKQMREKYPDEFIGIAVHYDDALGGPVEEYCATLYFPSFPSAYVNRTHLCGDPMPQDAQGNFSIKNGLEAVMLEALADVAPADLALTWTLLPSGQLGLIADTHFAINALGSDYRLTAVAVEDAVARASYYQTNYYSNSGHEMGGFESQPGKIVPYTFDEVARASLLPFEGVGGAIPAEVEAGRHYAYVTEVKAPTYDNLDRLSIVLMLLDGRSGEVLNAVQTPAVSLAEYEQTLAGCSAPLATPLYTSHTTYGLDGRRLPNCNSGIYIEGGKKHIR